MQKLFLSIYFRIPDMEGNGYILFKVPTFSSGSLYKAEHRQEGKNIYKKRAYWRYNHKREKRREGRKQRQLDRISCLCEKPEKAREKARKIWELLLPPSHTLTTSLHSWVCIEVLQNSFEQASSSHLQQLHLDHSFLQSLYFYLWSCDFYCRFYFYCNRVLVT